MVAQLLAMATVEGGKRMSLPTEVKRKLGVKIGEVVAFYVTDSGVVFIVPHPMQIGKEAPK